MEQEGMLSMLEEMVSINSGTHNVKGVKRLAEYVLAELNSLGFETSMFCFEKAGPILVSENKGKLDSYIILLGHMDTVFDDSAQLKNPFRIEENRIYGPGVADMKSGIVQIIYALKALQSYGKFKYGIKVILVGDEETGHPYSNAIEIFQKESLKALSVLCCETGRADNQFVLARKGVATLTINVCGKSAHPGNDLATGRNAISALSKLIVKIDSLYADPEAELTASIGLLRGGTAANVVPDSATAEYDVRFTSGAGFDRFVESIDALVRKVHHDGITTDLKYRKEYPPMIRTVQSEKLLRFVSSRSEKNGFGKLTGISAGGGADSAYFSAMGAPTICSFGPVGRFSHTDKEFIDKNSFFERTMLLIDCLLTLQEEGLK